MKLNYLIIIQDALEALEQVTGINQKEIVNNLIGICWDEEEASEIKESIKE